MKTVDAHVVESRIVTCKKCGQQNRLYERTENGRYRCAACQTAMPNPFKWQHWLIRMKGIARGRVVAGCCGISLLIYAIGLQARFVDMQRQKDSATKDASESRLFIEKLQKSQREDQTQIKSLEARFEQAQNEVTQAKALAAEAQLAQAELERRRKAIVQELVKLGIPMVQATAIINPSVPMTGSVKKMEDAMLRHLPTDDRLATGSVLVDQLRQYTGNGKLTLDNGQTEDAYVKLVLNGKLMAAFYVRSLEKFTYYTISDGSYLVLFCTGYGWDARARDFARGRHAHKYDAPLNYTTRMERDATGTTTITDEITLTLHTVLNGNTKASDISLEEFDRY